LAERTRDGSTSSQRQQQADDQDAPKRTPMYEDPQKLLDLLERCQKDARNNTARKARDRADLKNLKVEKGGPANQWIVWDQSSDAYIERPYDGEAGLPPWFFRATSNYFSNKVDGIASILNQSQPAKNWYATKEDDKSRAAADVCEMADPVLLDEIDYPHSLRPRLNKLVALTNLAGVVLTYDTDPKWGEEELPVLQCQQCQEYVHPMDAPSEQDMCPSCGGALDWAVHPQTNMPMGVPYPKGRLDAELLTSFEVSLPQSSAQAHEDYVPWLCAHRRWATEDAISRWPKLRTLLSTERSGASGNKTLEQSYADQMRNLSSPIQATSQAAAGSVSKGPVIWRLWHDPIDDDDFYFPDGVYLVVLEGADDVTGILEDGPLPFEDGEGRKFKNVLLRQYATAPGSAWGKPPADDLAPLQEQLNLCQALAFLILMHHASPRTFIPSTVTLNDKMTGQPGKDIGFRALVPGDKPIVEPGTGFPEALKWFIEFLIQQFDTISKLNAVLMGERPQGDPTLGEVEILQERGFAAFQEPLEQLVAFERRLSLKLLWITRACGWSDRYAELLGENGQWKLQAFSGADLEGHVTVDIDLATAWPKSPMLTNMRVQKAFELGILNPQDPEVQEEYLKMNDLLQFKQSTDADRDQVARQLDIWKEAVDPRQIEPPQLWWRIDYHLFRKTQFLKSETFEAMRQDPSRQQVVATMLSHVQMLQMMLTPATDEGAEGETEPQKGEKGALNGAVQAGAVVPARGKGARGALDKAAGSGAVRPAGTGAAVKAHARKKAGPSVGDLVGVGAIKPAGGRAPTSPKAAS
jgi:hypothetical protein